MAEMKDVHIVEIPVDEEHQQKLIFAMNTIAEIQNHPLAEISNCPGHLLLLKLWQSEENLFGRRIALKESRMVKICSYWKVSRQLQREKNNDRALTKCIQELRMKGASFDLSKEPLSGKRIKSSSISCAPFIQAFAVLEFRGVIMALPNLIKGIICYKLES
ncbi:hypothetical protein D5086_022704 [Populus alba]|uniref:Uncharacterized protein n=1 Tax=Populus alba TaxID=43335 RepID=A0ACC4BGE3_POPAL